MNAAATRELKGLDPIGDLLLEAGAISEDQLRIALTEQQEAGGILSDILTRLGFATEAVIRDAMSGALGVESIDLARAVAEPAAMAVIPETLARRFLAIGLTLEPAPEPGPESPPPGSAAPRRRRFTVAMADPGDVIALDHLHALFGDDDKVDIVPLLASRADIERFLERAHAHDLSISGILREIETGEIDSDAAGLATGNDEYSQPIVRLVDVLLSDAVKQGASDIHFEPESGFLRVRYRIDGVLRQARSLHRGYWSAIAVRLKVMSGMNIAETRVPQDGRMTLSISGRDIDFRVSALPTAHGENLVLRVLDRNRGIVPLDALGLSPHALAELHRMMERPEGLILVTGPTGSGKTTTLYSMLAHLDREGINIMTLEDPVEYPMSRIRQTSINEAAGLGFADGVRSLLRQDPDLILVGEVRDADTAAMTLRAAMTGHQVFSTLHTNSAVGAIPRLLDLGVAPGVLAGNIIGIVAQRLARRLCPACRAPAINGASTLETAASASEPQEAPAPSFRAAGCPECAHQGYRGRLALTEVLRFDEEIDDLVARGAPVRELVRAATGRGFTPLADDALRRVRDGSTSEEEVARVVGLERADADAAPTFTSTAKAHGSASPPSSAPPFTPPAGEAT